MSTYSVITEYIDERVAEGALAASSAEVIGCVLSQWVRYAGPDPTSWTPEQARSWVNDPGLRPSTRKSRLTKLRPFVRWLVDREAMPHDITSRIARIHVPRGRARDLERGDVVRVLEVCPDARATLIVLLMVHMGLRCGDVARIRMEDIDVRGRRLHVRGKGGRGEPTHHAPIPMEAWHVLTIWIRSEGRSGGALIRSYQRPGEGLDPHTMSKLVGRWIRAAGLKAFPYDGISAHSFRHTCAQHLADGQAATAEQPAIAPLDVRMVQKLLGHATLATTEGYIRRDPPGLRDAMEQRRYLPPSAGEAA